MMDDTQVFDTSWNATQPDVEQNPGPVGLFKIGGETLKVYSGQKYTIGRGSQASLMVPVKSLSKKHIEIEYVAGTHLICDLASKNKTRRGKLVLLPGVKYELLDMTTNQYKLVLGDTEATYHYIQPGEMDETNEDEEEKEGVEPTGTDVEEIMCNQPPSAISHISFDRQPQSSTPSKVLSKIQVLPDLSEEIVFSEGIQTVPDKSNLHLTVDESTDITRDEITVETYQNEEGRSGGTSEADDSDFILATQAPQPMDESTSDSICFVEDSPLRETDFSIVLGNVPETPCGGKVTAGILRTPSTDLSNISDVNTRNELNTLKLLQQSNETIPDSQPMSQFILGVGGCDTDRSENSSPVIGGIDEAAGFDNEDEETDCEENPEEEVKDGADDWDQDTQCFDMARPDSTNDEVEENKEFKEVEKAVEKDKDDEASGSTENITEIEELSTDNSKEADKEDEVGQKEGFKDVDDTQKITGEALTESMINDLVDEIKIDQNILRTPVKNIEQLKKGDVSVMSLTMGSEMEATFSPSSQRVPHNKDSEKTDTEQISTEIDIEKEAEDSRSSESLAIHFQPDEDESTSDSVKTTVLIKRKTTIPTRSIRNIVDQHGEEHEQISNKRSEKAVELKDEDQILSAVEQDDDDDDTENEEHGTEKIPELGDKKQLDDQMEMMITECSDSDATDIRDDSEAEDKGKKAPTLQLEDTLESQAEEKNMWKSIMNQSVSDITDGTTSEGLSINVSDYTAPIGDEEHLDDLVEGPKKKEEKVDCKERSKSAGEETEKALNEEEKRGGEGLDVAEELGLPKRVDTMLEGQDTIPEELHLLTELDTYTLPKGLDTVNEGINTVPEGLDTMLEGLDTIPEGLDLPKGPHMMSVKSSVDMADSQALVIDEGTQELDEGNEKGKRGSDEETDTNNKNLESIFACEEEKEYHDPINIEDTYACTLDLDSIQWTSGTDNFFAIKDEPEIECMSSSEIERIFEEEIDDTKPNIGSGRPARSTRGQKPKRFSELTETVADVNIKDAAGVSARKEKAQKLKMPEPISLDRQPPRKRLPPAKKQPPAKKPVRASRATKKREPKIKRRDSSCEPPEGMLFPMRSRKRMIESSSDDDECLDENSSEVGSGDSYEIPVDLLFPMKSRKHYDMTDSEDENSSEVGSESEEEEEEEEDDDYCSEKEKKLAPKKQIPSGCRFTRAAWQTSERKEDDDSEEEEVKDKRPPSKKQSTSRVTRASSQQYTGGEESVTRTSKRAKPLITIGKEEKQLSSSTKNKQISKSIEEEKSILSSAKVDKQLPTSGKVDKQLPTSEKVDKQLPTSGKVDKQLPTSGKGDKQLHSSGKGDKQLPTSGKGDKQLPSSGKEKKPVVVKKELDENRVTILKLDSVEQLLKKRREVREMAVMKAKGKGKKKITELEDSLPDCSGIEGDLDELSDCSDDDDEIQLLTGPVTPIARSKPKGKEPLSKSAGKASPVPTRSRKTSSVSVQKEPEVLPTRRSKRISGESAAVEDTIGKKVTAVMPCTKIERMTLNLNQTVGASSDIISDSLEEVPDPANGRRRSKKVSTVVSESSKEIKPPPLPKGKAKAKKVTELVPLSECSMEEMKEASAKDRKKTELGKRKKEESVMTKGRGKRSKISSVESEKENVTSPIRTTKVVEQLTPSRHSIASNPQTTTPPNMNSYTSQPKIIIVFTGIDVSDTTKRTIKALSGTVSDDIKSCSHLITDKVKRTVKFLCAIGRGIPIVNDTWIQKSKGCKSFIESEDYIIKDKAAEKLYMFDLKKSIDSARKTACLDGWSFHPTKSCKPDANQLDDILTCNGGKLVRKIPKCFVENLVVLAARTENVKVFKRMGFPVCTTELILTGVLRQKLSIPEFKL